MKTLHVLIGVGSAALAVAVPYKGKATCVSHEGQWSTPYTCTHTHTKKHTSLFSTLWQDACPLTSFDRMPVLQEDACFARGCLSFDRMCVLQQDAYPSTGCTAFDRMHVLQQGACPATGCTFCNRMHVLQQDACFATGWCPATGCKFCNRMCVLRQDAHFSTGHIVLWQDTRFATGCVSCDRMHVLRQDAHLATGYMSCDKISCLVPPTSASRRLCMAVSAELLDSSNLSSAILTSSSVTLEPGQPTSTPCQHEHWQSGAWGTFNTDQTLSAHTLQQIRHSLHTLYSRSDTLCTHSTAIVMTKGGSTIM